MRAAHAYPYSSVVRRVFAAGSATAAQASRRLYRESGPPVVSMSVIHCPYLQVLFVRTGAV